MTEDDIKPRKLIDLSLNELETSVCNTLQAESYLEYKSKVF